MNKLKELFNQYISSDIKAHILKITQTYLDAGYECWIVGGPVRDLLLNHSPKDIDFATNCPLEITKTLFQSIIPTGEDHGTLTIHIDGENYEVTRYRKDVDTDGRRATIAFANTIQEDVLRRDLTINAIAFNPITYEIVDAVGGLKDFETRTLRFVGNTKDRVLEDHLRFIRLLRFKVKLDFILDKNIIIDAKEVFDVTKLSYERIYDEIGKILDLDLTIDDKEFIIGSLNGVMMFDYLFNKTQTSNIIIREIFETESLYPIIYHNGWEPTFKLSSEYKKMNELFNSINVCVDLSEIGMKKLLKKSKKDFNIVMKVLKLHSYYNGSDLSKSIDTLENVKSEPLLISDLAINGNDLIGIGLKGKKIGETLEYILNMIYEFPEKNKKTYILEYIKSKIS